jgi:hypothetical protein
MSSTAAASDDPAVQEVLAEWMASNGAAQTNPCPPATPSAVDGLTSVATDGNQAPADSESAPGIAISANLFSQQDLPQVGSGCTGVTDAASIAPAQTGQVIGAKAIKSAANVPVDSTSIGTSNTTMSGGDPGNLQLQMAVASAVLVGIAPATNNSTPGSKSSPVGRVSSIPIDAKTASVALPDVSAGAGQGKQTATDSSVAPLPAEAQKPDFLPPPISSAAPASPVDNAQAGSPLVVQNSAAVNPTALPGEHIGPPANVPPVTPPAVVPELSSSPPVAAEKIAGPLDHLVARFVSPLRGEQRKTLSSDGETVECRSSVLGINVAKAEVLMPSSAPVSVFPSSAAEHSSVAATPLVFDPVAKETAAQPMPEIVSSASHAVDSVLAVTENFTSGERNSVNLQFSVSGVDLAVRVDLRGDVVHTVFRTDSPELRVALEREWQSVAGEAGDRSQRLADPVFTSASSGSSTHSNSSATDQRGSNARQGQFPQQEFAGSRAPRRNDTVATAEVRTAHSEPLSTVRRLHAFA